MHIDTSSIADRINPLRPNLAARSQSFGQAAITNDQAKSKTDATEDIAAKHRAQFATQVSKAQPSTSDRPSGAGKIQPDNPIKSLMADWGKADSKYDLNSDGTVDTKDLLMLFEKLAAPENTDEHPTDPGTQNILPVNPDTSDSQTDQANNRIDALLADWGKADSNYDLNSDGTVNTKDLLMLFEKLAGSGNADESPPIQGDQNLFINEPNTSDSQTDQTNKRIDALLADWGKADSVYDLNTDGTVNTKDLLMLLEKLSGTGNTDGSSPIQGDTNLFINEPNTSDSQTDKPDNRIDALLADWGKADSVYDLNTDGTVNTKDLLMLFEMLARTESSSDPPIVNNNDTTSSQPEKPDNRIDALMADWGKADSFYDFNTDGTVNTKDLLMLLEKLSQHNDKAAAQNPTIGQLASTTAHTPQLGHSDSHASVNHAYQRVSTDQAVNQLSQRLAYNGESELRKFLATSDYTNTQKRSILSEFHNLNMGSLGVNVVG